MCDTCLIHENLVEKRIWLRDGLVFLLKREEIESRLKKMNKKLQSLKSSRCRNEVEGDKRNL
jgi:hypothetical protein